MDESWPRSAERFVEEITRQAGRIVAIVASKDGRRLPIDWLLDLFFLEISRELERREVPRRVVADMLGVSRRTLMRRLAYAEELAALRRRTEWLRIYEAASRGPCTREELSARLRILDPETFGSIVRDMIESGWLNEVDQRIEALSINAQIPDTSVTELIELAMGGGGEATVERVAREYRLDEERVRALWPERVPGFTEAHGEAAQHALTTLAHTAMKMLGHAWEGARQAVDMRVYWVPLANRPADALGAVRAAYTDANLALRTEVEAQHEDDGPAWDERTGWVSVLLQQFPRNWDWED